MPGDTARSAARVIAKRMTGDYPLGRSYHLDQLRESLPSVVRQTGVLVEEETRLVTPGVSDVLVVDRLGWVERNYDSFRLMLAPIERRVSEKMSERSRGSIGASVASAAVAAEMGGVLGLLSRRVLGQYELVVPGEDVGDSVAFVGSNLLEVERSHQLVPSEFRTWVALHESTHRAQFVGVPWMRSYFLDLVNELISSAQPSEGAVSRLVEQVRDARRTGNPVVGEMGILGVLADEKQKEALSKVQALMSLLEGHGHAVMDRLATGRLVSQPRLSALMKVRRKDTRSAWLMRLVGFEMKIRQYEVGEKFVLGVANRAGWTAIDQAWSSPAALPSYQEIQEPEKWLRRVG